MIRVLICLLCCALSLQKTHAQLLLTQQDSSIAIYDLASNNVLKLFPKVTGHLSGYRISNDSIFCYITHNGVITAEPFALSRISRPVPKIREADYIQQIEHDTIVHISEREKLIATRNCIGLCVDHNIRWTLFGKDIVNCIDCKASLPENGRINLSGISIDPGKTGFLYVAAKWGFVVSYSKIYHVDLKNGAEKLLVKRAGNPYYSPDGLYILYRNAYKEEYKVMHKTGSKMAYRFNKAYWVYEKI